MTSNQTRRALLVGATGLVGTRLLELLLADAAYGSVHVLARRAPEMSHPRLTVQRAEFDRLGEIPFPEVDDVFCCLGTTIKVAGSQEQFRAVDHDAVLAVARRALDAGAKQFLMVSAMGANPRSSVFYNRVKGDIEAALGALAYRAVWIFRPSFLAGDRKEPRPGERLALAISKRLAFLIPLRYRSVADIAVARAMLAGALRDEAGVHVVESDAIQRTGTVAV